MSQLWEKWQGQVVNGVLPLQRYLGASGHSGVFLTELPKRQLSTVAIKLVPAGRGDMALVDSQLARWRTAAALTHPHLLTLLDIGRCELDGMPCAYAVMEYADQTLAQLLLHRVLTEDEAREMLVPALDALEFLHDRGFVHGGLKPPNFLVVGEQLKLASDTVRMSGSTSTDIQGLGRTLVEALTRRAPPALSGGSNDAVALAKDVSPAFREIIARCLSSRLEERPDVGKLRDWIEGRSGRASTPQAREPEPPASEPPVPEQRTSEPAVPEPRASEPPGPVVPAKPSQAERPVPLPRMDLPVPQQRVPDTRVESLVRERRRASLPVAAAVVAALVLGWLAVHQIRKSHQEPVVRASPDVTEASVATAAPVTPAAAAAVTQAEALPANARTAASTPPTAAAGSAAPSRLHEAIPSVPLSARETIQGHVKVWVRVSVDKEGRVVAVRSDRPGPSRYFERLALDAAKKWTFPPVEAPTSRLMQVQFEFSRSGTTGHAVTLH
jgi:TonB family protein